VKRNSHRDSIVESIVGKVLRGEVIHMVQAYYIH
jgi:hypothetical protein